MADIFPKTANTDTVSSFVGNGNHVADCLNKMFPSGCVIMTTGTAPQSITTGAHTFTWQEVTVSGISGVKFWKRVG